LLRSPKTCEEIAKEAGICERSARMAVQFLLASGEIEETEPKAKTIVRKVKAYQTGISYEDSLSAK
jgi:hypothetical protein